MKKLIFKGVATALVTPFNENNEIDYYSFENLIDLQLRAKTDALVVCGTTGEASTLTYEERKNLISLAKKKVKGKIPIIVGAASNNAEVSKRLILDAEKSGADAILAVTPYYNKTTQRGLVELFELYAKTASVPIVAYDVPSRTGVDILPETYRKIEKIKNVVAVKEADGDVNKLALSLCFSKNLAFYSGNDGCILPFLSLGAKGVVSVLANVCPKAVKGLCDGFFNGQTEKARRLQLKYTELIGALFCAVNPIPVKYVMSRLSLCKNVLRSPLTTLDEREKKICDDALKKYFGV